MPQGGTNSVALAWDQTEMKLGSSVDDILAQFLSSPCRSPLCPVNIQAFTMSQTLLQGRV